MLEKIADETPPAAAAKQVVTSVSEVNSGSADNTEPPLNPNQPNHRIIPLLRLEVSCVQE